MTPASEQDRPTDTGSSAPLPYTTPQALLDAITARVRNAVEAGNPYTAGQLRQQLAYDRLLTRVFLNDPQRWALKGAGNLLARIPEAARYSLDIDLLYQGGLDEAVQALREAVRLDIGDHFRFEIETARKTLAGARGLTLPVISRIGPRLFEPFSIDLVTELAMTGPPESVGPLRPIELDGLTTVPYRGYPIADQIADKHCAIIERHGAHGELPSTRYRDLVDLVLIATTHEIDANQLHTALHSEYYRRELEPPTQFQVPEEGDWETGYHRTVNDAPGLAVTDLHDAIEIVGSFLNPVLSGDHTSTWDPRARTWSSPTT